MGIPMTLALADSAVRRLSVTSCLCRRHYSFLTLSRTVMTQIDLQQKVNNREAFHMAQSLGTTDM
jgi:hypothetical protein